MKENKVHFFIFHHSLEYVYVLHFLHFFSSCSQRAAQIWKFKVLSCQYFGAGRCFAFVLFCISWSRTPETQRKTDAYYNALSMPCHAMLPPGPAPAALFLLCPFSRYFGVLYLRTSSLTSHSYLQIAKSRCTYVTADFR